MFPFLQWLIACVVLFYVYKFAIWLDDRADRSG